jgi:hypothetical protein
MYIFWVPSDVSHMCTSCNVQIRVCISISSNTYHFFLVKTFKILSFSFFFYCCAGWGYIVAFRKVLTIYQIYHSWIHPLYHFPLSLFSHQFWNSFNRFHFSTYVCTQYLHHIHPHTPFPHFLPLPLVPVLFVVVILGNLEHFDIYIISIVSKINSI